MIKKLLFNLFLLLLSSILYAQETYYNDVNLTLTGIQLKQALATKITNTHTKKLTYSPDIWNASKITDANASNINEVVLLYGWENGSDGDITNDRTRNNSFQDTGNGNTFVWNREHVYPKSLANPRMPDPQIVNGIATDAHNLRPTDKQRNSDRSNLPFAAGTGFSGKVNSDKAWYPGDEWKGDVARIIMYMYLRYGDQCLPTAVGFGNADGTPDNMIDLFLQWNVEDPVSDIEKARNSYHENTTNTYAQGNRNPFIDNPFLATRIWGGDSAIDTWGIYTNSDKQAPTTPTNIIASAISSTSFTINWNSSTDNIAVTAYDIYINGNIAATTTNTYTTLTNLNSATAYTVSLLARDGANNKSAQSNTINITTRPAVFYGATELFISEYVEPDGGNNKAIEIVNLTNSSIDLTNYSIKKQQNGGAWVDNLPLTKVEYLVNPSVKSIAQNDVFVLIHGNSSDTNIINKADLIVPNNQSAPYIYGSPINFNGNDAIGLFKNDVLIDIVGEENNANNHIIDVTLRRKSSISSPNTTYTVNEWDVLAANTFDGIGKHSATLSVENIPNNFFKVYPNPLKGSFLNIVNPSSIKINTLKIYTINGKEIISIEAPKSTVNLNGLQNGLYIIKLLSNQGTSVKKLIKN